jgi:sensor histidine kinase YesM
MAINRHTINSILLIILQIFFWAGTLLFFIRYSFIRPRIITTGLECEFLCVAMIALMVYLNYFVIYPVFIRKRRWILYGIVTLISILIIACVEIIIFIPDFKGVVPNDPDFAFTFAISSFFLIFLRDFGFMLFFLIFKHYRETLKNHSLELNMLKKEIVWEKEKYEIEKSFISSKMAPHYLFNVVNQLYLLAVKKNDRLPGLMRKLSAILDFYMIESNKNKIEVQSELDFYQDYIDLELLRHPETIEVKYKILGEADNIYIVPLIFENFIGNAFKYTNHDGTGEIIIIFDLTKSGYLQFRCENSKPEIKNNCVSSGNGLKIVRKRLDILYPNAYSWDIQDKKEQYKVFLNLKID